MPLFTYTRVGHDGLREHVDVPGRPDGTEHIDWIYGCHADDTQGRALLVASTLCMTDERADLLAWEAMQDFIYRLAIQEYVPVVAVPLFETRGSSMMEIKP